MQAAAKNIGLSGSLQGYNVGRYLSIYTGSGAGVKAAATGPSLTIQQRQEVSLPPLPPLLLSHRSIEVTPRTGVRGDDAVGEPRYCGSGGIHLR